MSAIKDIVDLAKDLESRAKDRRDIDVLRQIHALAFSLQSQNAEVVERDLRLVEENAKLKRQLEDAQAEDVRIHSAIEFRRGKRTGGAWMPFCPQCHMPTAIDDIDRVACTASCIWTCGVSSAELACIIAVL
jgi:hypothetical protein